MSTLLEVFRLLLQTAASVLVFCLLLRVLMQWAKIHPNNPLAPFIFTMTDWLVRPIRRFMPGFGGIDWATVLGAFFISYLLQVVLIAIASGIQGENFAQIMTFSVPIALFWLIRNLAYLLMGIVLVQVILSWVNPFSPFASLVNELSRPFLEPLRRIIPTVGNVDLTPLVFFLIVQVVMIVLQGFMPAFY